MKLAFLSARGGEWEMKTVRKAWGDTMPTIETGKKETIRRISEAGFDDSVIENSAAALRTFTLRRKTGGVIAMTRSYPRSGESTKRRSLLKFTGGLVGFTTIPGVVNARRNSVAAEQKYDIILPGDNPSLLEYYYQSDNPMGMESNVGGTAVVCPRQEDIQLEIDLTEDDNYGAAGFRAADVVLDDISEIQFATTDPVQISLQLGITYNEETVFEWEEINKNKRRWTGFDGDDRAFAVDSDNDDSPIGRDDPVFWSPSRGAIGEKDDISIDWLQSTYGNIPVRVGASIDGGSGTSRSAKVKKVDVI